MNLQYFFEEQDKLLNKTSLSLKRYLFGKIDLNLKCTAILGQRGVGKTTLMLQIIKSKYNNNKALYISIDSPFFQSISLYEFAKEFEQMAGEVLFIDEVHKYPNWASHIKEIYDKLDLKVIFSGSSILKISKQNADLSRRAVVYNLENLSFREYLLFNKVANFDPLSLEEILEHHQKYANEISQQIKPLKHFKEYLKTGAYPFFLEDKSIYHKKIVQILNIILESDLPYINQIEVAQISKLKKLLYLLAISVPFVPNITDLSQSTNISRPKIYEYLQYLEDAKIINSIRSKDKGYSIMSKPQKLFMQNSNISYAITQSPNIGALRETFFVNQIKNYYSNSNSFLDEHIYSAKKGDFLVDNKYIFEIGGKNKGFEQIKDLPNSFVAADDIEIGFGNKIPLWLFGFLYWVCKKLYI